MIFMNSLPLNIRNCTSNILFSLLQATCFDCYRLNHLIEMKLEFFADDEHLLLHDPLKMVEYNEVIKNKVTFGSHSSDSRLRKYDEI